MTVLSDSQIEALITSDSLVVGGANKPKIRSCSVDLTVGTLFWDSHIIPYVSGESPKQVKVPPGGMIAMFTAQSLKLPANICGTAFAINAQSSEGLLVLNPGHVDPGFEGPLTVKALNIRQVPLVVQQGDPIFTVIFSKLDEVAANPYGKNVDVGERERKFNQMTVEKSADSLSRIIEVNRDGPFPGRDEVRGLIWKHWSTIGALALSILAVVFSGYAAWASYIQLARGSQNAMPAKQSTAPRDTNDQSVVSAELPAGKSIAMNRGRAGRVQESPEGQIKSVHEKEGHQASDSK